MNVDEYVMQLEAPLRALKPLGREAVEDILTAALDDVFEDEGDRECPGHPNDGTGVIGETQYCDGTCAQAGT